MPTEQSIIDQLFRDYGQPRLLDRDFNGYRAVPIHERMFFSMRVLECEIENGGIAQLLWNTFYHWRGIAEDCLFAYAAVAAEPQAAAMPEVIRLMGAYEAVCGEYVSRAVATKNYAEFQAWYAIGESAMSSPVEMLLYPSKSLDALKQAWISARRTGA